MANFYFTYFVITIFVILFRDTSCRRWQYKPRYHKFLNSYMPSPVNSKLQYNFMQNSGHLSSKFFHWLGKRDFLLNSKQFRFLDRLKHAYTISSPEVSKGNNKRKITFKTNDKPTGYDTSQLFLDRLEQLEKQLDRSEQFGLESALNSPYSNHQEPLDTPYIYNHIIDTGDNYYNSKHLLNKDHSAEADSITDIEETLPVSAIVGGDFSDFQNEGIIYPDELFLHKDYEVQQESDYSDPFLIKYGKSFNGFPPNDETRRSMEEIYPSQIPNEKSVKGIPQNVNSLQFEENEYPSQFLSKNEKYSNEMSQAENIGQPIRKVYSDQFHIKNENNNNKMSQNGENGPFMIKEYSDKFLVENGQNIHDILQNDDPREPTGDLNLPFNDFENENWKSDIDSQNKNSVARKTDPKNIINTILQSLQLLLKTFSDIDHNGEIQKPTEASKHISGKFDINQYRLSKRPANIYSPISPFRKFYLENKDDKFQVVLPLMRKYPYSNVVRLSSGCTGTLLTPIHVLTAAHCVHDGEDFKTNLEMLKIEIPDTMGFRVYYIKKISIPKSWRRSGHLSDMARSSYDYAIVRLSISVPGKTAFVPLSVPKLSVLNQDMNFLGFPKDGGSGLYRSECRSPLGYSYMNLIVAQCDSVVGNSGAAVYIDDPREGKRIVGVLSNIEETSRYSFIMALTWSKLFDICSMMAPLGQIYGVCPNFETTPVRGIAPVRSIPFFG